MGRVGLTLVVLAAGVGSRFGGAKQVEAVGPSGETIIDYSIFDALRCGFDRVVFITRPDLESILRERFDGVLRGRCDVVYVHQRLDDLPDGFSPDVARRKPLGTGHALFCCRNEIGGPFAVINADDFYGAQGLSALRDFLTKPVCGECDEDALVGYSLEGTLTPHGSVSRGVCRVDADGCLESIVERRRVEKRGNEIAFSEDGQSWTAVAPGSVASMNLWGFTPEFLAPVERELRRFLAGRPDAQDELRIPTVVGTLIDEGAVRVRVLRSSSQWYGVTYREDLPWVRAGVAALVERGAYPSPLWAKGRARGVC